MEEISCQPRAIHPAKLFQKFRWNKDFSDSKNREFTTSIYALQEMSFRQKKNGPWWKSGSIRNSHPSTPPCVCKNWAYDKADLLTTKNYYNVNRCFYIKTTIHMNVQNKSNTFSSCNLTPKKKRLLIYISWCILQTYLQICTHFEREATWCFG